jgi:hypothetical protein
VERATTFESDCEEVTDDEAYLQRHSRALLQTIQAQDLLFRKYNDQRRGKRGGGSSH